MTVQLRHHISCINLRKSHEFLCVSENYLIKCSPKGPTPLDKLNVHHDSSVKHTKSTFYFDGEVDVTGSINNIDNVILPTDLSSCRLNGDTLFSFQIHRVHLSPYTITAFHLDKLVSKTYWGQEVDRKRRIFTNLVYFFDFTSEV